MMNNILQARLLGQVEKRSIADIIGTRAVERTGYSARFAPVVAGGVKTYDSEIKWEQAAVKPVVLNLEYKDYFAFIMDDVEALKTNVAEIERQAQKQSRQVVMTENKNVLTKISEEAKHEMDAVVNDPATAYEMIVDANRTLSKQDAPENDRFMIIDHSVLGMLEKDARFTSNYRILENGLIEGANVNGASIIVTNHLPEDTVLAVQKDGVGFERFLDKVQVLPVMERQFGSGFRGLNVYDAALLDEDCILKINVSKAAAAKATTKASKPAEKKD